MELLAVGQIATDRPAARVEDESGEIHQLVLQYRRLVTESDERGRNAAEGEATICECGTDRLVHPDLVTADRIRFQDQADRRRHFFARSAAPLEPGVGPQDPL